MISVAMLDDDTSSHVERNRIGHRHIYMKRLGRDAVSQCGSLSIRLTAAKISTWPIGLGNQGIDLLSHYYGKIAQLLLWDRWFGVVEAAHVQ